MGEEIAPVLYNRDLILIYISAIAILWNLWFFSFWSVSIVSQAAPQATFLNAALTAALNAGAGILGFPIGGWLAAFSQNRRGGGQGIVVFFSPLKRVPSGGFWPFLIKGGGGPSPVGILLFFLALFFF